MPLASVSQLCACYYGHYGQHGLTEKSTCIEDI